MAKSAVMMSTTQPVVIFFMVRPLRKKRRLAM
jgi:hypothetical protein